MLGKTVVITGVPGVGKTTVINGAIDLLRNEGVVYNPINFGTFMFDIASREGLVTDRDEMRKLDQDVQRRVQRLAAQGIAQTGGNIIVDTHCTVSTPRGFLAGLPEWVLRELKPDIFVLVETDEDQILTRRLSDESRVRDREGYIGIRDHQQFNRSIAASYAMLSGCTVKIIRNADFLLDKAVADMADILR
ncbi:MAG: adenylate kinase [Methanoculleus sp. SDB]|nr:MAG: adenylate kinase [Methanoculleus sp. SDB]